MKHINPFDRMVQEQLANESEAAPMHLWDDIDITLGLQEQEQKKKKRRFLLLFFFLLAGGMGIWGSYDSFYDSKNLQNSSTIDPPKTMAFQTQEEPILERKALLPDENQVASRMESAVSSSLNMPKEQGSVSTERNNRKAAQSGIKTQKSTLVEKSTKLKNNKKTVKTASIDPILLEENIAVGIDEKSTEINEAQELVQVAKTENGSTSHHIKTDFAVIKPLPNIVDGTVYPHEIINDGEMYAIKEESGKVINTKDASRSTKEKKRLNNKKKTTKKHQDSNYKALKRLFAIAPNPGSCYSFGGKNFDLRGIYVDAIISSDLPFRTLSTTDSEMVTYKELRDHSESYYWAGSGGLRLSVVTNSGLAFRTGLIYAQITERFKYENLNAERITIENFYDNNNNIIRTDTMIVSGKRQIEHSNHYNMFDVPLILGYEVETEKLVFHFNAGAYFNLLFKPKGRILSTELNPIDINNTSMFRKNLGISYFGSVGFNYKFTRNLHLVIEPQIRYYPKSFTRDDYVISQKYFNFGFFTGLRFRL